MKLEWILCHNALSLLRCLVIFICFIETATTDSRTASLGISSTIITLSFAASTNEDIDPSQFPRRLLLPYYHADVYGQPRRKFRFEEFLWAGSGDGPISSESQDGMAWEDDNQSVGPTPIKITKTMVLYKTVLSTVYPVGMTPVVVITSRVHGGGGGPPISPTLALEPSPTYSYDPSLNEMFTITSTNSLDSIFIEPTKTISIDEHGDVGHTGLNDKLSAASSDIRYWIQTVIKKKRGALHPNDAHFEESMQNKLAGVYATAFKRQMLKSLGVNAQKNNSTANEYKRVRRRSSAFAENPDPKYFFLTEPSRIARTAMNVTVTMVNISWSDSKDEIDMKYVVYAEETPIPGFVAVKELRVMTKSEMEKKIGYDIINKAEALVQPNEAYAIGVSSSTPWMIALMAFICLMILILVLTMFMAWKWKNNRLRDRQAGNPSVTEAGHISPALGRQREGASAPGRRESRVSAGSPASSVFRADRDNDEEEPVRPSQRRERQGPSKPSEESPGDRFAMSDDKGSSDVLIKPGETSSSYHSHSPRRRHNKSGGVAQKVQKRKRSRRRKSYTSQLTERGSPARHRYYGGGDTGSKEIEDLENEDEEPNKEFSFTNDVCRNMDKISFGNLDICSESEARVPSAQARRIISRPSSHEQKRSEAAKVGTSVAADPNAISEALLKHRDREVDQDYEQDRALSEQSFEVTDSAASGEAYARKDAEVQTPTRLGRHSPRVRTSPRHRHASRPKASKMSLLSTESEEAVEFMNLNPSSSDELNPLGRMRKRFHQFLDDAFNVMATGRKDNTGKCPQSAKVTLSHQMKTKAPGRPWTSHVIREESVRKIRPKSSVVMGPPKSAWGAGSERRCQSARSKKSAIEEELNDSIVEDCDEGFPPERQDNRVLSSSRSSSLVQPSDQQHQKPMIFPKYPTYPEVEICLENDPNRTIVPGSSHSTRSRLHPLDPAVPLIEAIKDEMKRFEKVKVSGQKE